MTLFVSIATFFVVLLPATIHAATPPPVNLAQGQTESKKSMNCYIASRNANRENTRINCVYKCPNGKTEAEVVPKGVSCPPFVNVPK